ncbi:MAG: hypothetical protein Q4E36_01155 [Bacillota bacterium]|nr:hypothetical protein [Bacillota bacterium]
MKKVKINKFRSSKVDLYKILKRERVLTNQSFDSFIEDPKVSFTEEKEKVLVLLSVEELGFKEPASLEQIIERAQEQGYKTCHPADGFYLRLDYKNQEDSTNNLYGKQDSDCSITIISDPIKDQHSFPKGLNMRKVSGQKYLRGYTCDYDYEFPLDTELAFALE